MKNNTNKETWINEALNSTSGMHRATPHADLYDRVMAGVSGPEKTVASLPAKHWIAAAVLLLIFNITAIIYAIEQNKAEPGTAISGTLFTEIQSTTTYNY